MKTLLNLLHLPDEVREQGGEINMPIYLKYCIRCLTSASRSVEAVQQFVDSPHGFRTVMDFIAHVKDEEILANCSKIVRICLKDEYHYVKLTSKYVDVGNELLIGIQKFGFSEFILIELLAAFRNFCRKPDKLKTVEVQKIDVLISLATQSDNEKV